MLFSCRSPGTRLIIEGEQSRITGEESTEPFSWTNAHALQMRYPVFDDEHDLAMLGQDMVHSLRYVKLCASLRLRADIDKGQP